MEVLTAAPLAAAESHVMKVDDCLGQCFITDSIFIIFCDALAARLANKAYRGGEYADGVVGVRDARMDYVAGQG